MTFWTPRSFPGGTNISHGCMASNSIYYGDKFKITSGGATANNPNGDVYRYNTDTQSGSLIYDASTFNSSPKVHRMSHGLCSHGGSLYGMFTYYNSTGPQVDIMVEKFNGTSWSTVLTVTGAAASGGKHYGFLGTNGSRMYALFYTSTQPVPAEPAVMYYSDDGSSWSPGVVGGDPVASTGLFLTTYYKTGYFPGGVYGNFWEGDGNQLAVARKIFGFSGGGVSVVADNTAANQYYRSRGDDNYNWANTGSPPEYFSTDLSSISTPSNNASVDEQMLTENVGYSYAGKRVGVSDGTELWRNAGGTWSLFDLIQIGGGGPNFACDVTWLLRTNTDYWIFGYDYYLSTYRLAQTPYVPPPGPDNRLWIYKTTDKGASWENRGVALEPAP